MKKALFFLLLVLHITVNRAFALDIDAGTYYFDNSKTKWTSVQFLYGTDNPARYMIIDLTDTGNNKWKFTIPTAVKNIYRYSFTFTSFPPGTFYDMSFSQKKDDISSKGYVRIATQDQPFSGDAVFIPQSGDNWAQGSWSIDLAPTKTIPVFYLNTENNADIVSKDYYINATMYIDAAGIPGYTSSGTAQNPIVTGIKGRGNWTWSGFDKKPYRIKMDKKAKLLNMSNDKSYALLAHADDATFLREDIGFELSRRFGFPFTPGHKPVELVKNGEYWGLYYLTENIKVSNERVNIVEQPDGETDPYLITGGWLIEIDNYDDVNQVSTQRVPRFTCHTPEAMSPQQEAYIRTYLQKVEDAIYNPDKNSVEWEKYIDLNTFVDFYIVQEVTGNTESFHGSCYFYKDIGENSKIYFGPVWDFGNAFRHPHEFIYQDFPFTSNWLPEIVKYPRFQDRLIFRWTELRDNGALSLDNYIDETTNKIREAVKMDYARWPQYGSRVYDDDINMARNYVTDRIEWLDTQWYRPSSIADVKVNHISAYPNPTSGEIRFSSPEQITAVKLFNLPPGKQLKTFTDITDFINLDVDNGMYLLQIYTPATVESHKIMVEK